MIELLVVMALVGILMGLLLPAISHIRLMSMQRESSNNLANLARAAISYATDNEGLLPRAGPHEVSDYSVRQGRVVYYERAGWVNWINPSHERAEWQAGGGWSQQRDPWSDPATQAGAFRPPPWWGPMGLRAIREGTLYPYTSRNPAIYLCPGFARRARQHQPYRSFVMNNWFHLDPPDRPIHRGRYLQHIESTYGIKASRLLLFAHLPETVIRQPPGTAQPIDDGMLNPETEVVGVYFRNRALTAFVDGHVSTIGLEEWRDGDQSWSDLTKALCLGTW